MIFVIESTSSVWMRCWAGLSGVGRGQHWLSPITDRKEDADSTSRQQLNHWHEELIDSFVFPLDQVSPMRIMEKTFMQQLGLPCISKALYLYVCSSLSDVIVMREQITWLDRIFIFAVFVKKGSLCRERRGKMTAWAIKKEADFEDDFTRPVLVLRFFPL